MKKWFSTAKKWLPGHWFYAAMPLLLTCLLIGYLVLPDTVGQQYPVVTPIPTTIAQATPTPTPIPSPEPSPNITPVLPTAKAVIPASQYPITITNPASMTVVVNKKFKLPLSYIPAGLQAVPSAPNYQLRQEAAQAYELMKSAAAKDSFSLKVLSAYRSYQYQVTLYNRYVAQHGQASADRFSARPGHSEHQLGLVVDVGGAAGGCDLEQCFANTAEGKWIAANSHLFGFIIRYPQTGEAITGYMWEPWHIRYMGVETAGAIYYSGKTVEDYFGVVGGGY